MKKECKVLALIFIIGVVIILSVNIVSASLLGDIGNWLNKLFGGNNLNVVASTSGDYRVYARFEANSQFVETN